MERKALAIPEIALISGTRAALGAGVGLLLGEKIGAANRRAVGWALLGVGVLTTIPILMQLFGSSSRQTQRQLPHTPQRANGHQRRRAVAGAHAR